MSHQAWNELLPRPANPAAATNLIHTVDSKAQEAMLLVRYTLTTSASVGNRTPYVAYTDGDGTEFARFTSGLVVAASGSMIMTYAARYWTALTGGTVFNTVAISDIPLLPGYHVVVGADAMLAGDQISGVSFYVRRLPTGSLGEATGVNPYHEPELEIRMR